MKISIISASHRTNSQSKKISNFIEKDVLNLNPDLDIFSLDLADSSLPLWSPDKKNGKGPEYGGMATPAAKNIFLLCGNGEFAHKPGLIVSVSSGNGGAYPIAELRSSSYKNTHIMWIPENIIIRNVEEFNPGSHGKNIPNWLDGRIDYVLNLLLVYASNMKPLRTIINRKDFGSGM